MRFIERVSAALEHVDGSSGAIGSAVHRAIAELVPIIAQAPADDSTRDAWLERLWTAHETDEIPYIESLGAHWGTLCATPERAGAWADRLIDVSRVALRGDGEYHFFPGTEACLSSLLAAGRHDEVLSLLRTPSIWHYQRWAVDALLAQGRKAEAVRYAEAQRGQWASDPAIDTVCEQILLSSGLADEAYRRYGCAHREGTYLATFRRITARYPHKAPRDVLTDLAGTTPGKEGKWFAAANDAGLHGEALELARRSPCDPRTLTRAARDSRKRDPAFALEAALLAIDSIVKGYGFDITSHDVWDAHDEALNAASGLGVVDGMRERLDVLAAGPGPGGSFVREVLDARLVHRGRPIMRTYEPQ